jgi:hypothetical protein
MALGAEGYDFLRRSRGFSSYAVGYVFVGLGNALLLMAVQTSTQGFFVGYCLFWQGVYGIEMAKFAAGFRLLLFGRIIRLRCVYTGVVYVDYMLVGKSLLGKRRDHVAEICTVDLFRYWIMGNLLDVVVTFPTGDSSVNGIVIYSWIDVVIDPVAVLIDSAKEPIFVAHEAIVLVSSLRLGNNR